MRMYVIVYYFGLCTYGIANIAFFLLFWPFFRNYAVILFSTLL